MIKEVALYVGEALGKYGFPDGHPFGPDRQDAFLSEAHKQRLDKEVKIAHSGPASREEIERHVRAELAGKLATSFMELAAGGGAAALAAMTAPPSTSVSVWSGLKRSGQLSAASHSVSPLRTGPVAHTRSRPACRPLRAT